MGPVESYIVHLRKDLTIFLYQLTIDYNVNIIYKATGTCVFWWFC